jgi:DNA-binding response OmpR family regulator/anti-sigma regulatory factor (Ser/Thr protein kinase)
MEQDEAIRRKELDTFKSQLFTNLTHEFRTPLTVILGMANQLAAGNWKSALEREVKEKVSLGLTLIENNGKNLLHLINQLLDLSKLENKSFKLHSIQSDIVPYVRYVTESFQSYADDINLSLRFITHVDSLMMDFDPEQLKQILTNLISNALKFTPSGGEIKVELSHLSGNLEMVVTDTGIGISEKDLPHVLERFYQADSSDTRAAQGTGIGLAHTQELLKIMGGNISVESETGKGTCVFVQLPIRNKEVIIGNDEIARTTIPRMSIIGLHKNAGDDDPYAVIHATPNNESKPQLLIIEDSPDVVLYLRSCLEHTYQIDVAYNGKIGIEKALEDIPDLIVSDVMMPEKDGYEVCDILKNDERTSHIPIILLTAKADAASRMTGFKRGADAYLAKPFDPEELLVRIAMLLDNRRRMAAYFSKSLQIGKTITLNESSMTEDVQIEDAFVKKVKDIIEANYSKEEFSLPELCKEIGMSRSQLFRKMKAVTDTAPSDLIRSYRLIKAKEMLEKGDLSVAEVTYQVGFKDPSYFSKLFQEEFGVQPSTIKNSE